jgi:hypothetical protein
MNLVEIIQTNRTARMTIIDMNLAEITKKYGVTLSQARQLQQQAFLVEAAQ